MAKLRWTAEAQNWLRQIHEYIASDNLTAADRTILGIMERAEALQDMPLIGYRYPGRADRHYRVLWYGHYRIVYLVRENDDTVDIVGVFHQAMEIERYL